jgi:DNA-binding transcriptional LysR family regulator
MKNDFSLDDLSLFTAVAEAGGLSGALGTTGQSAPTLSRKMAALEKRMNRRLFLRGPKG